MCFDYDQNWDHVKPKLFLLKCKALYNSKQTDKAIEICQKAYDLDGNVEAIKLKGEAHLIKEEYEEASRAFQKAVDGGDHSAHDGLNRARKLEKMAKRKDYYKILGIDRSASERDIKVNAKKLILKYHPDKLHGTEEEKKIGSKKYYDIVEAYEVLSDQEKKEKYDRGDDIDERQQFNNGGGGNPFGGFGFNFGNVKFNWG